MRRTAPNAFQHLAASFRETVRARVWSISLRPDWKKIYVKPKTARDSTHCRGLRHSRANNFHARPWNVLSASALLFCLARHQRPAKSREHPIRIAATRENRRLTRTTIGQSHPLVDERLKRFSSKSAKFPTDNRCQSKRM